MFYQEILKFHMHTPIQYTIYTIRLLTQTHLDILIYGIANKTHLQKLTIFEPKLLLIITKVP